MIAYLALFLLLSTALIVITESISFARMIAVKNRI